MATPRAPKPVASAISVPSGVPPESGDTLATGLAPSAFAEPGATAGNRLAALPPGLTVGVGAATPGGGMADSDDKLAPTGLAGARTVIEPPPAGSRAGLAALPVPVRPPAVTVVAVTGTVTCACSCRWAEPASIAPR